ncbi:Virginiamycin A acetyltransferase [bioreactor metagenome]|uniref:Virginiamycin A acetyltransferase n=1 Tax=bioreactor metagenome TaxID=1076179 RepID=A0A644ZHJ6_9ZZZZ
MVKDLIKSEMLNPQLVYPRKNDRTVCYLKNVITNPNIDVGDFTFYHDFNNPENFESQNVLYHYPINNDKLIIGKFCSIACGTKFIFNAANHTLKSFSTYPFPLFLPELNVTESWDNKGDIIIGNDVWIGFDAVIMSGVHIGNGAIIGTRAVVTKDIPPYSIVGGIPAKIIRKRFDDKVIEMLQKAKWWEWEPEIIIENMQAIRNGDVEQLKSIIVNQLGLADF